MHNRPFSEIVHDVMIDHVITEVGVAMVNLHIGSRDTTRGLDSGCVCACSCVGVCIVCV